MTDHIAGFALTVLWGAFMGAVLACGLLLVGLDSYPMLWVITYAAILLILTLSPRIFRELRGSNRIKRGLCPKCAYDLRGSISPVCPECGKVVKP